MEFLSFIIGGIGVFLLFGGFETATKDGRLPEVARWAIVIGVLFIAAGAAGIAYYPSD